MPFRPSRLARLAATLLIVAALAIPASASAYDTEPGALGGTVRDWVSKNPLPGVEVRLYYMDEADFTVDSSPSYTTTTDVSGAWSFAGLPNNLYVIAFAEKTGAYRDVTFPGRGWNVADSVGFRPDEFTGPFEEYLIPTSEMPKYRGYRVSGADRYQTAIQVSKWNFTSADTVVLASGASFPDALAAAPLAGVYEAPILLTQPTKIPSSVINEIKRLRGSGPMKVYIVGGTASVSNAVRDALVTAGITNVSRIAGSDRYDTASKIALKVQAERGGAIWPFIARGDVFADALSVSAFAYMERRPILLVKPSGVPGPTRSAWAAMHDDVGNTVTTVGGSASITNAVLNGLAEVCYPDALEYYGIEGSDRYNTCANLVSFYLDDFWGEYGFDVMGLASGETFPDALTGGAARGANWGPIVLTTRAKLSGPARTTIAASGPYIVDLQAYGGPGALADGTLSAARSATGGVLYDIDDPDNRIPLSLGAARVYAPAAVAGAAQPGRVGAFDLEAPASGNPPRRPAGAARPAGVRSLTAPVPATFDARD